MKRSRGLVALVALLLAAGESSASVTEPSPALARLITALLGDTPLVDDVRTLNDTIGGRPTGSEANRRSVEWAVARWKAAGVDVRTEPFTMPMRWMERSASSEVRGERVMFTPRVAAMPFSSGTTSGGTSAPLVDIGRGTDEDFAKAGAAVRGAFVLVEQDELTDIPGLFREYVQMTGIEQRAFAADVAGVVYMGSRPHNLLYRHNVSVGPRNTRPMVVMERDAARRAQRLLRDGVPLQLTLRLDIERGGAFESHNVIGEIRGATRPDDVVIVGAHLDSWDLGGGTLDNGANVAVLIDIARQIRALGLAPARTIRFALWNGEEQGLNGSLGYVRSHQTELENHIAVGSLDMGCGRITGFFTGGRPDVVAVVDRALLPVSGLGPFQQLDVPVVGTDNYDFMMEGVPNFVANHESALYGPNYHARSDEFDRCDMGQLRLNAIVVAAFVYGLADSDVRLPRHTRAQIEELMRRTDLPQQMRSMGTLWDEWVAGTRGRRQPTEQ